MEDKIEVDQIVKQKTIKEVKSKTIRGTIKEAQCLNNMIFRNRIEKKNGEILRYHKRNL